MGLSPRQRQALQHLDKTGSFPADTKSRTINALVKREVIQPVEGGYRRAQKEMIDNPTQYRIQQRPWSTAPTVDLTEPDYGWWERAALGKVDGMRLAGMLLKPVKSKIAAFVLGNAPTFKFSNDYTQKKFAEWFGNNHADILRGFEESVGMGMQYLVVNPDTSLTVTPPNVVERLVEEFDYSQLRGYRITEVWPHPQRAGDTMTIEDEYTFTGRVRILKKAQVSMTTQRYKNLTGLLSVIPIANMVGSNEIYGRPEMAGAVPTLGQYDDVLHYSINGNKRQGRATPVISKMGNAEQIKAFWQLYGREITIDRGDGKKETYMVLDWDGDKLQTLGENAEFDYKSPGSFMTDTEKLLGLLYYLYLEHSELPEFVLGTAVSASKASTDTQMPVFDLFIQKKQMLATNWLKAVAHQVVSIMALSDSRIRAEVPTVKFKSLISTEGELALKAVQFARQDGMMNREDGLSNLPIDVEDPAAMVKRADKEAEEQKNKFDVKVDAALANLETPDEEPNPDTDEVTPDEAEETAADLHHPLFNMNRAKVPA